MSLDLIVVHRIIGVDFVICRWKGRRLRWRWQCESAAWSRLKPGCFRCENEHAHGREHAKRVSDRAFDRDGLLREGKCEGGTGRVYACASRIPRALQSTENNGVLR